MAAPPRWQIALFLALSGLLMWAVVAALAERGAFFDALRGADWSALPLVLGIAVGQLALSTWRWVLILRAVGCGVPFRDALAVVLTTWPLAALTPSRLSDLLRAWLLRERLDPFVGAGTVVAEKVVDLLVLCLLGGLGLALSGLWWGAGAGALVLLGALGGLWLLVVARERLLGLPGVRRVRAKLAQMLVAVDALRTQPRIGLLVVSTAVLSWSSAGLMLYALLGMFHAGVAPLAVMAFWPAAIFAGLAPVTLAGLGTRDAAFVLLLRAASDAPVAEGAVLAATLGYALFGTWSWAIVGLPFTVRAGLSGMLLGRPKPQ